MSDDFFEDGMAGDAKPQSMKVKKTSAAKSAAKRGASGGQKTNFSIGQKVDVVWVIAIAVVAFTIGFLAHAQFFGSPAAQSTGGSINAPLSSGGNAPPLSADQVQQFKGSGGKLPPGHPSIGNSKTGTGKTTPKEDTGSSAPKKN